MKSLNQFISEKLKISKRNPIKREYKYKPISKPQLREIILERMKNEGPELDLNDIDTSLITSMRSLFRNKNGEFNDFNGDISEWDVSNVENMAGMFYHCKKFNGDLSNWDVSNVENMSNMFSGCSEFEGIGLDNWKTNKLEDLFATFSDCIKFNADISDWDVSHVYYLSETFDSCYEFDQNLEKWDIDPKKVATVDTFIDCKSLTKIPTWYKHENS